MAPLLFEQRFTRISRFSSRPVRRASQTLPNSDLLLSLENPSSLKFRCSYPSRSASRRPTKAALYSMNDFRATLPHYVCILHPLQHRQCYLAPFSSIRPNMDDYMHCVMHLTHLLFRGVVLIK